MAEYKLRDRVAMLQPYDGNVTASPGGSKPFSWRAGDAGTLVGEATLGAVFWVKFDKEQAFDVLISTGWFEHAKPEAKVLMTVKDCTCPTQKLMAQGCVCGAWKRYVEPHKR